MLKFEKVAQVGDVIRAYDFKPMLNREDIYLEGVVLEFSDEPGFMAFKVRVINDVLASGKGKRVDEIVFVPMEVYFMEWDGRIINLSR